MHHLTVRRFREVLAHADLAPGQRVLDLGCGWAYGTHWAHALGCRATGIDLGFDQLQWAARSMPRGAALVHANARALPFADGRFDRAVSVEMMEHVYRPDRPAVFAEIARVIKRGGRVALSTPNPDSPIESVKRVAVKTWAPAYSSLRRALPSTLFPGDRRPRGLPPVPLPPPAAARGAARPAGDRGLPRARLEALPVDPEDAAHRALRRRARGRSAGRGAAADHARGRDHAGVGRASVSAWRSSC